ncbi:OLC1v1031458C1 [Oldenlandia corymbosa var. corymbosa]|uniref:OLC1v1031458C1 n=1 Tax=Oldenlandia corymbosa var. corymbosa TaxID=529605 RepID=A0AAV1CIE5_OLDCO|nr:OLC1v1031458C1 [Oldenlandia corymbosa var. corymbosa]
MAEVLSILGLKLTKFPREEGRFLEGLQQEVQLISDEFGHMKAFLQKVSDVNQEDHDPQLAEWIRQVREVSHDTEDILDVYKLRFASRRPEGWIFKSVRSLSDRHRLVSKLKDLKDRIKNISEARLRYEPHYAKDSGNLTANNAWRHSTDEEALLVEEAHLPSREQNMVTILSATRSIGWSSRKMIRRLVLHHNLPEIIISPECQHYIMNVRSIINIGKKKSPSEAVLTKLLSSKLLTVVILVGIDLEEILPVTKHGSAPMSPIG